MRVTNYINNNFQYVSNTTDNLDLNVFDYCAFGSLMPGRQYSSGTGYRFGFNGKEMDNEISGSGNQYDYGFGIYNPRLGKFLSVDPLTKDYPELTPYQYSSNCPISCIDLDGLEGVVNTGFGSDPLTTFAFHMSTYLEAAVSSLLDVNVKEKVEIFLSPSVREKTVGSTTITQKRGSSFSASVTVTVTPSKLFNKNNYSNNTYAGGNIIKIKAVTDNEIKVVNTTTTVLTPTTNVVRSTSGSVTISSTNPENVGNTTLENKVTVNTNIDGIPVTGTAKTQTTSGNGSSTTETSVSVGVGTENNNISVGGTSSSDNSSSANATVNLGFQNKYIEVSTSTSVEKTIPKK